MIQMQLKSKQELTRAVPYRSDGEMDAECGTFVSCSKLNKALTTQSGIGVCFLSSGLYNLKQIVINSWFAYCRPNIIARD